MSVSEFSVPKRVETPAWEWPVFLSYRRSPLTEEITDWLFAALHEKEVHARDGQRARLNMYLDRRRAVQPNFGNDLRPHLSQSRALIFVLDAGATTRRASTAVPEAADFLYSELDWWREHHPTDRLWPIILETDRVSSEMFFRQSDFEAWSETVRLPCYWEEWKADASRFEAEKSKLLTVITESVRDIGVLRQQQEYAKLKRRLHIIWIVALIAAVAAVCAVKSCEVAQRRANDLDETNQNLVAETQAKQRAGSKSDFVNARHLREIQLPAAAAAYLLRAIRQDPENKQAWAELLSVIIETPWLLPATETVTAPSAKGDQGGVSLLNRVIGLRFNPEGNRFIVGVLEPESWEDDFISARWFLYETQTAQRVETFNPITTRYDLRFSADGKELVGNQPLIRFSEELVPAADRLWDAATGVKLKRRTLPKSMDSSGLGRSFIDGAIVQTFLSDGSRAGNPVGHGAPIRKAFSSIDGRFVAVQSAGELPAVMVWQVGVNDNDPHRCDLLRHATWLDEARFSQDRSFVALRVHREGMGGPPITELYRLREGMEIFEGVSSLQDALLNPVEFKRLAPLHNESGEENEHAAELDVIDFSRDNHWAVSAHAGCRIQVWQVYVPPSSAEGENNKNQGPRFDGENLSKSLRATPALIAVLHAFCGQSLSEEGELIGIPASEWLKWKANAPSGQTTEDRLARWLLEGSSGFIMGGG